MNPDGIPERGARGACGVRETAITGFSADLQDTDRLLDSRGLDLAPLFLWCLR